MNSFVCGKGTLKDLEVEAAAEALGHYFDALGEPIATLDEKSPTERLDALLRLALGINVDLALAFVESAQPGRFNVVIELRDTLTVADFDVSLGLVSIFVRGPSELVMLEETLTPWRYDVFDGAVTKRPGRMVMDGPAETVSSFGPSRSMKMTPEELYEDAADRKPMTPARAAQVAQAIADVMAKRNDPPAPPG